MWVGREMEWGQQCGMLFLCWGGWVKGYPHQIYSSNMSQQTSMVWALIRLDSVCTYSRSWLEATVSYIIWPDIIASSN